MSAYCVFALLLLASVGCWSHRVHVVETVNPASLYKCRNPGITAFMYKHIAECAHRAMPFFEEYFLCMSMYYLNDAMNRTIGLNIMCVAYLHPEQYDDSVKYRSLDETVPHPLIMCANIYHVPQGIFTNLKLSFCQHHKPGRGLTKSEVRMELTEAQNVIFEPIIHVVDNNHAKSVVYPKIDGEIRQSYCMDPKAFKP